MPWVKLDGNQAVFGITDHAQSLLGDVTFVELPEVGAEIKCSDSVSTVESVKAASDIYAPLSGKITEVNTALDGDPGIMNRSPYGEGWLCRMEISDSAELDGLMDAASYEKFLEGSE